MTLKETVIFLENIYSRTEALFGKENMLKLKNSRVAVFGIGGVGGYAVEMLARSGVGNIDIFDNDTVSITNINRQIIATSKTVGMNKTDACKNRVNLINPEINVICHNIFYSDETDIDLTDFDYIIDAIDTVSSKISLIVKAYENNVPIISSMGTGNKVCPEKLEISDIYKTSVCPLARVMRYELKKRNVKKLKVVYSKEEPFKVNLNENTGKAKPASTAFVPATAGILLASEVIKDIIDI